MSDIFDTLYQNHFINNNSSSVTSGHWKYNGGHEVAKGGDRIEALKGFGFGQYSKRTFARKIKYLYVEYACDGLLSEYNCLEEVSDAARNLVHAQERIFTYDCANMAICLSHSLRKILEKHQLNSVSELKGIMDHFTVIGDGYGTFGTLIKLTMPWAKVSYINLGRTLIFDYHYTQKAFPEAKHQLVSDSSNFSQNESPDFYYVEAENYELLTSMRVDLAINTFSMQEMNLSVIANYFKYLREASGEKYFYCLNREEKLLPEGEVTIFDKYPWSENDEVFTYERCPWAQDFPYHFPPFKKSFVGPMKHAFVKLGRS